MDEYGDILLVLLDVLVIVVDALSARCFCRVVVLTLQSVIAVNTRLLGLGVQR